MGEALVMWGIVMLLVSLGLIVAEAFLPSAGIITLLAIGLAIGGLVCLFRASWMWGASGLLAMIVLAPTVFVFALKSMPATPWGKRILFGKEGEARPVLSSEAASPLEAFVGVECEVVSDLRPVGQVKIDGKRYDARSEVGYVRVGSMVRVTRAEATEVIVRPV
jgi:membrane-bound serine protease (ClpP class)